MNSLSIQEKLTKLRKVMQDKQLDAWLAFTADPHLSEYLPEYWQTRSWLSGFTGSAGFLVVTAKEAVLWTDSRYWVQAEQQLKNTGIYLIKQGSAQAPTLSAWLLDHLQEDSCVGLDGMAASYQQAAILEKELSVKNIQLQADTDIINEIWESRPKLPDEPVYSHDSIYVALSVADKLHQVREKMATLDADWHLISSLDDIAWILNLRGADVPYNPVFLSFLLINKNESFLFIDTDKCDQYIQDRLQRAKVSVLDYQKLEKKLAKIKATEKVLLDPNRTTWKLAQYFINQKILALNPSQQLKAEKTEQEIAHVRQAMEYDGVALCEFFSSFEKQLQEGKQLTELDVAEQLEMARSKQPTFISLSFATIAGFNDNGALPHYQATPEAYAELKGNGLLLIDSGGQYLNGTTDITRVVPIGEISKAQQKDFTLVLKGMINLSRAVFPKGIHAPSLDALARVPLWQEGLDFGHGTGHGVGYFLNVHEGPQGISYHGYGRPNTQMYEGMITSNEPGLYRSGQWGIRIENLVCNQKAHSTEFGEFLKFETLTLCPIDTRCILKELLSTEEVNWLNNYHEEVRKKLQPYLKGEAKKWLLERTKAI